MSKLSDISLLVLIIGTLAVISSFFLFTILTPAVFLYTLISGLSLCFLSLVGGLLTKNEYRVISLKSGFPLKFDHLIIMICALAFLFSFTLFMDILHVRFTGTFPPYTLSWVIILISATIFVYYFRKKPKFSVSSE